MRIRWTEPGPARPLLQVRLAAGGRLMIEAYGVAVIVAKVFPPWRDAWLLWAGADRRREVLPPWTAGQCREYAPDPQRWFFEIRRQLQASALSPLHAGGWSLSDHPEPWDCAPTMDWLRRALVQLEEQPDGAVRAGIHYVSSRPGQAPACSLVPSRLLSSPEAPRVKAHRRLAREGALAPVVLLVVSGLDGYLVLDGHDRLVAAMAEGIVPAFACLSRDDKDEQDQVSEHDAAAQTDGARPRLMPWATMAWPLPAANWKAAASRISAAWLEDVAAAE